MDKDECFQILEPVWSFSKATKSTNACNIIRY